MSYPVESKRSAGDQGLALDNLTTWANWNMAHMDVRWSKPRQITGAQGNGVSMVGKAHKIRGLL